MNASFTINIPVFGDLLSSELSVKVFENETDYWIINTINYCLSGIISVPSGCYNFSFFFIPNDLNWSKVVSDFQQLLTQTSILTSDNITATEIDNGFIYNTPEGAFNETHKEIEVTLSYNEKGVLKNCEVTYDDTSLLTFILSMEGEESIIGYDLLITITTSSILILSMVFFINKRRKSQNLS